jgi:arylsulfatase A-like enzyme
MEGTNRGRRWTLGAALALLGLALGACRGSEPPRNVVFILVDTLRADHLPLYGYARDTSPNLAAFARESTLFSRARSQAACTWPSANSILTSRVPELFLAAREKSGLAIPEDTPSIAEILAGRGFSTAAVSSSLVVRATPSKLNKQGGFGRGFQSFDESCRERSASCVNERAFDALDRMKEPFFLYLHYLEPHQDYQPPKWHPRRFAVNAPAQRWVRLGDPKPIARQLYDGLEGSAWNDEDVGYLRDLYDEEILFFDGRFAELMADLERRGVADRTAVVLVSDHGEEILDHGHIGHCRDLAFENLLRTPMVMRLPGAPRGVVRDELALNLDVVPTLLDYLQVPYSAETFDGRSLRPLIEQGRSIHRLAFAAQGRARVVTDGALKLRLDLGTGVEALFDLGRDPGESTDRAAARPADRSRLSAALREWMARAEAGATPEERVRRAQESEAELRALGYL